MAEKSINRTERLYYLSICVLICLVAFHVISREYQISSPGPFGGLGRLAQDSLSSLCETGRVKRNDDDTRERRGASLLSIEEMCKNEQSAVTQNEIRDFCWGGE